MLYCKHSFSLNCPTHLLFSMVMCEITILYYTELLKTGTYKIFVKLFIKMTKQNLALHFSIFVSTFITLILTILFLSSIIMLCYLLHSILHSCVVIYVYSMT